jgi:hypothetical protein
MHLLLVFQLLLILPLVFCCITNEDCPFGTSWQECRNNECKSCSSFGTSCPLNPDPIRDPFNWPCCGDNICQFLPKLNRTQCVAREWCRDNSDCGTSPYDPVGCIKRTGKCDLCYGGNDNCLSKKLECCEGHCDSVLGVCLTTTRSNRALTSGHVVIASDSGTKVISVTGGRKDVVISGTSSNTDKDYEDNDETDTTYRNSDTDMTSSVYIGSNQGTRTISVDGVDGDVVISGNRFGSSAPTANNQVSNDDCTDCSKCRRMSKLSCVLNKFWSG